MSDTHEPRFVAIGKITRPHGLNGEVRVEIHTDFPDRFHSLTAVYLGTDDRRKYGVRSVRMHQKWVLLGLQGIDSRTEAENLRSEWVSVALGDAVDLGPDEYYLFQLRGIAVRTESGVELGVVGDVLETKANNVFVVRGPFGEILLPDIDDVIVQIDNEARSMIIRPMPGLLPREISDS